MIKKHGTSWWVVVYAGRGPRKGEIAERTMLGYASLIEPKTVPALGELRLSRVDTATATGSWLS